MQNLIALEAERLERWWASVDSLSFILSVIFLFGIFLLRRPLSRILVRAVLSLTYGGASNVNTKSRSRLERMTKVILVALGALIVSETLELPQLAGGFVRNAVATAAIIAIFDTWYELAGNFVSLIKNGKFEEITLEADWAVRVARFAILLFAITAVLKVWSVDISGALTGVGVFGAGLAIALQDLIQNFVAGMTNQSEKRFVTGDAIEIEGGFMGTIKRIDLRSTVVVGFDQVPRHVPNSDLSNSVVKNYSRMDHRRVLVEFGLVLSSTREQIEKVRRGLETYLRSSGDFALTDDAPKYVHIARIGTSSIDFMFYAWTASGEYSEYLAVCDRLALQAKEIVATAGTEFAYPTQTIQLTSDDSRSASGPL